MSKATWRQAARRNEKRQQGATNLEIAIYALRIARRLGLDFAKPDRNAFAEAIAAAEWMHAHQSNINALAVRCPPKPHRGWREGHVRYLDFLYGFFAARGIPLAAEGGRPLRCADRVTSELSMANYLRWQREQQAA